MGKTSEFMQALELYDAVKDKISYETFVDIMMIGRKQKIEKTRSDVKRYRLRINTDRGDFAIEKHDNGGYITYEDFEEYVHSLEIMNAEMICQCMDMYEESEANNA